MNCYFFQFRSGLIALFEKACIFELSISQQQKETNFEKQ
jgi:hypothetical protein